jgi:outer membrane protein TolC
MNKITHLIGILFLLPFIGFAQELPTISLQQCQQKAVEHFPSRQQFGLNQKKYQLENENLKMNYLPELNFNSQLSYQSDVTKVPISMPGLSIPTLDKDWYKFNVDINQLIWDGGITKEQKKIEKIDHQIADQNVKIKTYKLKQQVTLLYFNILFLNENIKVLNSLALDLNTRIKDAQTAVDNGMLLQSDLDVLRVKKMEIAQQITEKEENLKGLLGAMEMITGLKNMDASQFQAPKIELPDYAFHNNLPSFALLKMQQTKLEILKKMMAAQKNPIFKAFGQIGYGKPGYDMLNPDFDTYYMVGLRIHWKIWDWGKTNHKKEILDVQKKIIETEKQSFNQNLKAELQQRRADIQKFEKLLKSDEQILQLQKNVVATANHRLKNGSLTPSNYLIELNKQLRSRLNNEAHRLQLIFAKYQYITSIGKL